MGGSSVGGSKSKSKTGSKLARTEEVGGLTTESSQLKLDQAAIDRIIEDVLGGAQGLASIFQGEQTAGIFGSSSSAQAAGNLAAKLAGEIARITGETVKTTQEDKTLAINQTSSGSTKSGEVGFKIAG